MRMTLQFDTKYVVIEVLDLIPEAEEDESEAPAENVVLPVGFGLPPNVLDDPNAPPTEEDDEYGPWSEDPPADTATGPRG